MMRRAFLAALLLLLPVAFPGALRAQEIACDPGDLEVRAVTFNGNQHFQSAELASVIVTSPSSFARRFLHLPIGARRCLDTLELSRDAVRIRLFYRLRGYYKTAVKTSVSPAGTAAVAVGFGITEGPPVMIDTLDVTGLDSVAGRNHLLRELDHFRHDHIFSKVELQAVIDSVRQELHESGYPYAAAPLASSQVDPATDRAELAYQFFQQFRGQPSAIPKRLAHIGHIDFEVAPGGDSAKIDTSTVQRLLSFKVGDVYSEKNLVRSARDLYQLETYSHVDIALAPDSLQPDDSLLTVLVRLNEAKMTSLGLGAGWATLDCIRTQARLTDRDFLGGARRLELNARLSHLALCPKNVRDDSISNRLNYYASGTLRLRGLIGPHTLPSFTLFSERTSEYRAYVRETVIGGAAEISRDLRPRDLRPGLPLTLSYRLEYGRTTASPAVFCQLFNRCALSDIERLQQNGSLHVFGASLVRDRTDQLLDPSNGNQLHLELRSGTTSLDTANGTWFSRVLSEGSVYKTVGASTFAARLQMAAVLDGFTTGGATAYVPPEERLYAGGPNSVRGYNQNLLGPVVYIVDTFTVSNAVIDGNPTQLFRADSAARSRVRQYSPTGGNTLIVVSAEWRQRLSFGGRVQLATFVDAGQVWNRPQQAFSFSDLRVTPGVGVRVRSPIGPLRVDVAYNGYASTTGSAYYVGNDNVLRCVSPDNTLPSGIVGTGDTCEPTYTPSSNSSFFSKLTFNFSIGQAF
ncbi:MAG: BamA/TamA family outer membrane protein [Gemmatimonadaceae bacterium]|nr:BamA/TamA family outer membrane protein [Gemmatimonadaceae bacterium]